MVHDLQLFIGHRGGHYLGDTIDLEIIVTGIIGVQEGDSITVAIKDIYNLTNILNRGTTIHKHTIPSNILSELDVNDYTISATLNDGQQTGHVQYRVVPIPVASLVSLTPNTIQIPISTPVSITGQWRIQGEQMNSISGSSELIGLTAGINQLN